MTAPVSENVIAPSPEVIHYSPSQLATFKSCQRKWYFDKVLGFRPPQTQSQIVGTEIHAENERFIKMGEQPMNPRALEAIRWLPKNKAHLISERPIDRALHIPERRFVGFVDLTDLSDAQQPHVLDYKTTSDVAKYAKTDYQLEGDLQLNAYAFDTLDLAPKATHVKVSHLYIQTRKAIRSTLVSAVIPRVQVEKNWSGYLKIVDQIEQVRTCPSAGEVEPNWNACNDYGGCFHRARCDSLMFAGSDVSEQPAPVEAPANWWDREDQKMLLPPDTTRRPDNAPPATPDTVALEALPKELRKTKEKEMDLTKLSQLGNGTAKVESAPLGKTAALLNKIPTPPAHDDIVDEGAPVALKAVPPPPPPPTPTPEEPKKRGRPAKAQAIDPPAVPVAPGPPASCVLFLDCFPVAGFPGAVHFGAWVAPLVERIQNETGADWQFHEYRKGTGHLVQLAKTTPMPSGLIVNSRSPEAIVLMETLISRASMIFQGAK